MEWSDSLSVGVLEVDIQHKLLVENFNNFVAACQAGMGAEKINQMFWFLQGYAVTHFNEEEKLMLRVGFPGYLKHKQKHQEFAAEVGKYNDRLKAEGPNESLVSAMTGFISAWLVEHISRMDRAIGEFIASSKSAQARTAD